MHRLRTRFRSAPRRVSCWPARPPVTHAMHARRITARRDLLPPGLIDGAIKLYLLLYTTCTRVQTVPYNAYSCTGEMTPSIQVYTPDGSTRTAIQPVSLQMYSCAAGAMCSTHLCSTHHSRCTAVRTVSPGLCVGSGLTFFNNKFRVKARSFICRFGVPAMPVRIRGLNVQPEAVSL